MIKNNITIRAFNWNDLPFLTNLLLYKAVFFNEPVLPTQESVYHSLKISGFDPEKNCFVALSESGQFVGESRVVLQLDDRVNQIRGDLVGSVHPLYFRRKIGTQLLHACERSFKEATSNFSNVSTMFLQRRTFKSKKGLIALLEKERFLSVHQTYSMSIDLVRTFNSQPLLEIVDLRTCIFPDDLDGIVALEKEIFIDQWGYVIKSMAEWKHTNCHNDFNPNLWFIALHSYTMIGICLCETRGTPSSGLGYINVLGVKAEWRRMGIARQLLVHALQALQKQGYKVVNLSVDSQNFAAIAFYQSVGIKIENTSSYYRKIIPST